MSALGSDEFGLPAPAFRYEAGVQQASGATAEDRLEVFVIYTDEPGTRRALRMAEELTQQLHSRLNLLMLYEVPYSLPLARPTVSVEFLEDRLRCLAAEVRLEVVAQVCLCREKGKALRSLLPPHSLVIWGAKRRWPNAAQRLARAIQKDGHQLIFAELR